MKIPSVDLEMSRSTSTEVEFFSAEDSAAFKKQYGDQLGAVQRIDVQLETTDTGAAVTVGGATVERVGDRKALDHDSQALILDDVKNSRAVILPVAAAAAVRCSLQPILVVQALEAL